MPARVSLACCWSGSGGTEAGWRALIATSNASRYRFSVRGPRPRPSQSVLQLWSQSFLDAPCSICETSKDA